jgi:hypothetical protein
MRSNLKTAANLAIAPSGAMTGGVGASVGLEAGYTQLASMLEKSGYKDVSINASAFVIHAKDADGQCRGYPR